MATPLKEISKTIEDKSKLWVAWLTKFINERNPREKQMIIVLGLSGMLLLDYWILIHPVIKTYRQIFSQTAPLEAELAGLRDDQKNKKFIAKNWNQAKANLEVSEKRFIGPNEMPAFLENLSKLAFDSGVKVMSLQPLEKPNKNSKKERVNPYSSIPIRMSATGGTHEFGKFLSWLEHNPTFIRVKDIKIASNSVDDHRHMLELEIEVYRIEANA